MLTLRKQKLFWKALQFSEWLEAKNLVEFNERHYASHLDLIAKVHGFQRAECYIEKVPESSREVLYIEKDLRKRMGENGFRIGPLTRDALVKLYVDAGEVEKAGAILQEAATQQNNKVKPLFSSHKTIMEHYSRRGDVHNSEKMLYRLKQAEYANRMRKNGHSEDENELVSEPELSDEDDVIHSPESELKLDTEHHGNQSLSRRKSTLSDLGVLLNDLKSVQTALDKYVSEGKTLDDSENSHAMTSHIRKEKGLHISDLRPTGMHGLNMLKSASERRESPLVSMPNCHKIKKLSDIPPHELAQISRFFEAYTKNGNKFNNFLPKSADDSIKYSMLCYHRPHWKGVC